MSQTRLSVPPRRPDHIPARRAPVGVSFLRARCDVPDWIVLHPQGRLPLLCCLVAFIVTFFVTRTIVRYIRSHADSDAPRKWWQPAISGTGRCTSTTW